MTADETVLSLTDDQCQSARERDPLSASKRDPARCDLFEVMDVSLFGLTKGPFLRPSLISPGRRAQPRSSMAAGHPRERRAACLTAASTVPGLNRMGSGGLRRGF